MVLLRSLRRRLWIFSREGMRQLSIPLVPGEPPGRGNDTPEQTWPPPARRKCKTPSRSSLRGSLDYFLVEMIVLCFLTLGALHCAVFDDHVSKLIPMFEKESDLKKSEDM